MSNGVTTESTISAVRVTGPKTCRPILVEFRLAAPEAGYRIAAVVEKGCTAENDPIWKLVFDLYKKTNGKFEEIVHVSFKAGTEDEKKGIEKIAVDGVSKKAAKVLKSEVFPVAKKLEKAEPTEAQKVALKNGMSKATTVDLG